MTSPEVFDPFAVDTGRVYFVEANGLNLIKIGYAINVLRRILNLASASAVRLELKAVMAGDLQTERELHRQFKASRKHGEWFRSTGPLRDLMQHHALHETVYYTGSKIEPPRYRKIMAQADPVFREYIAKRGYSVRYEWSPSDPDRKVP